jgi:hypothetical protein
MKDILPVVKRIIISPFKVMYYEVQGNLRARWFPENSIIVLMDGIFARQEVFISHLFNSNTLLGARFSNITWRRRASRVVIIRISVNTLPGTVRIWDEDGPRKSRAAIWYLYRCR